MKQSDIYFREYYNITQVSNISQYIKGKNIFTKVLKDVGIEVPQSIETRCSMQAKAGDDSMQQKQLA